VHYFKVTGDLSCVNQESKKGLERFLRTENIFWTFPPNHSTEKKTEKVASLRQAFENRVRDATNIN
jgi:hypothetical protein